MSDATFNGLSLIIQMVGVAASILIAIAASVIAWKTAYGNKPVAMISHVRTTRELNGATAEVELTLEIWNMQRYPIMFASGMVEVEGWELGHLEGDDKPTWLVHGDKLHYFGERRLIRPNEHITESLECELLNAKPIDSPLPRMAWSLGYFDPRVGKQISIRNGEMKPTQWTFNAPSQRTSAAAGQSTTKPPAS